MHPKSLFTITEACKVLGVSRPTLNSYREEFILQEVQVQRHKKFFKSEILEKIYGRIPPTTTDINLMIFSINQVEDLMIDESSFDLRRLNTIGGFGVLCLLAKIRNLVEQGNFVYLLLPEGGMVPVLCRLGFFKEIKRLFKTQVEWNTTIEKSFDANNPPELFPIKYVGFKGQEGDIIEDLNKALESQGFSKDLCSYIAWVLGELADNSHTHGKGPCYFLIDRIGDDKSFLEVSMVDSGVGIEKSLKVNPKYKELSDLHALLLAFKSKVSSWPDEAERGKGLSDVLKIAMGNQGYFRVESNELSLFMNFQNYKSEITKTKPQVNTSGTRFAIMFIDDSFELPNRQAADQTLEARIKELI